MWEWLPCDTSFFVLGFSTLYRPACGRSCATLLVSISDGGLAAVTGWAVLHQSCVTELRLLPKGAPLQAETWNNQCRTKRAGYQSWCLATGSINRMSDHLDCVTPAVDEITFRCFTPRKLRRGFAHRVFCAFDVVFTMFLVADTCFCRKGCVSFDSIAGCVKVTRSALNHRHGTRS